MQKVMALHRWACLSRGLAGQLPGLAFCLLLAACGGSNSNDTAVVPTPIPAPAPAPAPAPTPTVANTVVAYPSETAEIRLYAGQSRQLTVSFRTSDGGSATGLALAMPAAGLPAGWRIISNASRCGQVDAGNSCQIALSYAPAAAQQSSVLSLPYSYRNNKGDAGTGNIAIAYRALAVNAATTTLLPAGPVRGAVGKTSTVLMSFGTNDGSPATDLHVQMDLAALPAGWTSPAAGFDCASFGARSVCMLALSYAPASAAPAAVLAIAYRYKDSSGRQQSATASIDYSATAPNTVGVSLDPPGVVRARAGSSQQVTLTFAPSDDSPASALRLTTDKLPTEWTVKASTLPCAKVDGNGGCTLTLVYAPGPDQPSGKLAIDYAYTDATGRELTGTTAVSYASHDYLVYVSDYGDIRDGKTVGGGVRQCELTSDGKLGGCRTVDTAWPVFGVTEVLVYNSRAYIGGFSGDIPDPDQPKVIVHVPDRQVTVCDIADDNALVDCAGVGPIFNQLVGLALSRLGAFVISVGNIEGNFNLSYCEAKNDGNPDLQSCGVVAADVFPGMFPYAVTSTDTNVYIAATDHDRKTKQAIFSCFVVESGIGCKYFEWGISEGQLIERMSVGQAGGNSYLYLATSALSDPQSNAGRIVKCLAGDDGVVGDCGPGTVPKGLADADLKRVRDLRIAGNDAWLVTGKDSLSAAVYRCPINPQTGDMEFCDSAGNVEGAVRNFGIAVR